MYLKVLRPSTAEENWSWSQEAAVRRALLDGRLLIQKRDVKRQKASQVLILANGFDWRELPVRFINRSWWIVTRS